MGLFGKKELCPVCQMKLKHPANYKIKDDVVICMDCWDGINMDVDMLPNQTAEDIRYHLVYRQGNQEKVDAFAATQDIKAGAWRFKVDESQKIWYATKNKKDSNPPVFTYDEVVGYQYTENDHPVEEALGKRSIFNNKKVSEMINSMKILILLNNQYTSKIEIDVLTTEAQVKSGSLGYRSARKAADRIMNILDVMTGKISMEDLPVVEADDEMLLDEVEEVPALEMQEEEEIPVMETIEPEVPVVEEWVDVPAAEEAPIERMVFEEAVEEAPVEAPVEAAPISGADEILKYKGLMDAGIITPEEFEAKKKQILGL